MKIRFFSKPHSVKRPLLFSVLTAALLVFAMLASAIVWPEQSGEKLLTGGNLTVDAGHASEGYILVKGKESKKRLKLRITYDKETLTYDLNTEGEFEVFPLQNGSGKYNLALYEQASGKKYSQAGKVTVNAKLNDEAAAFLCPSQYVDYTPESEAVAIGLQLGEGKTDEKEIYAAVCAYVVSHYGYDYMKAVTVTGGTLPDIQGCLDKKIGICQDLAAVTVCMLRVNGIHARLVIGYADKMYHAWVTAIVNGEEQFFDPTAELKAIKNVKTYTVERIY